MYVACLLLAGELVGGRLGRALRRLVVIEGSGDDAGGLELEALDDAPEVAPDRPEEVEQQYGHGQRQVPRELKQVRLRVGARARVRARARARVRARARAGARVRARARARARVSTCIQA